MLPGIQLSARRNCTADLFAASAYLLLLWVGSSLLSCEAASAETSPSLHSEGRCQSSSAECEAGDGRPEVSLGQNLLQGSFNVKRLDASEPSLSDGLHHMAHSLALRVHEQQQVLLEVPRVTVWGMAMLAVVLVGGLAFVLALPSPSQGEDRSTSTRGEDRSTSTRGEDRSTSTRGEDRSTSTRWNLIISSYVVMICSGSVYAMGAWQDELRDKLQLSMEQVTIIGACAFVGALAATLGGVAAQRLKPRATVVLGGAFTSLGYLMMGFAVVASDRLQDSVKVGIASLGSLLIGYSSVSLLDNIVSMACTQSFPQQCRAALVGLLKSALAAAAGLWALLWVHIFQPAWGLAPYLGFVGTSIFVMVLLSVRGITIIRVESQAAFDSADMWRYAALVLSVAMLACFDVAASFGYAKGLLSAHASVPVWAAAIAVVPIPVLLAQVAFGGEARDRRHDIKPGGDKSVEFKDSMLGLDFWLLFFIQFALFGAGVGINQNLALIMESAGAKEASALCVALFALTSALARIGVGVLSDAFPLVLSRQGWVTVTSLCSVTGLLLISLMTPRAIMIGALFIGLSFGAFYTVLPPLVREMYGLKDYQPIFMTQLCSQALSALSISLVLLPWLYRRAAGGKEVCYGAECFHHSFMILGLAGIVASLASIVLQLRPVPLHPTSGYRLVATPAS